MVCVDVFSRFERPDLLVLRGKQTNFIMQKNLSMKWCDFPLTCQYIIKELFYSTIEANGNKYL